VKTEEKSAILVQQKILHPLFFHVLFIINKCEGTQYQPLVYTKQLILDSTMSNPFNNICSSQSFVVVGSMLFTRRRRVGLEEGGPDFAVNSGWCLLNN